MVEVQWAERRGLARSGVGTTTSRSCSTARRRNDLQGRDPPAPNTECDNTYRFLGYGGTAPSPSLGLLSVATAMASSPRLGSGAVAP